MERNSHDFLEKVQSLDEAAKRKVLIASSVVVMVIVIAMWVVYFNNVVMSSSGTAVQAAPAETSVPTATPSSSNTGFWHTVGNNLSGLANIFTGGHEYIQPSH